MTKLMRTYHLEEQVVDILKEISHLKSIPMGAVLEDLIIKKAHKDYSHRVEGRYAPIRKMILIAKQTHLDL